MSETFIPRLSPDGKFIGQPPWRIGDGSNGVILRAAGTGAAATMATSTPTAISGLSALPAELQPGYTYELDLVTDVVAVNCTATGQFSPVYRTRNRATGTWSSWNTFDGAPVHYLELIGTQVNENSSYRDHVFEFAPTVALDQIEIGVVGVSANAATITLTQSACRLRVVEHLPQ